MLRENVFFRKFYALWAVINHFAPLKNTFLYALWAKRKTVSNGFHTRKKRLKAKKLMRHRKWF